jgi:hypothetical protein
MNKLFFLFFILLSTEVIAEEKSELAPNTKIIGSKNIPMEFNLMLDNLYGQLSNEKLLPILLNIDSYSRILSKEDIFLLGKIEIYKNLLKSNAKVAKANIDSQSTNYLRLAIQKAKDPFVIWFLKALLDDCQSVMSNPLYKLRNLQSDFSTQDKTKIKKIDKKIQLLYRWISVINPNSPDFEAILKTELLNAEIEALNSIEHSFYLLASSTNFENFAGLNKNPKDMKLFSLKEIKAPTLVEKKPKSVEDILSPILGEPIGPEDLPQPTNENWLTEDDAPTNLKNLPKASEEIDVIDDI